MIKKDLVAIDRIVQKIVHSCEGGELEVEARPQTNTRRSEGCEYKVQGVLHLLPSNHFSFFSGL